MSEIDHPSTGQQITSPAKPYVAPHSREFYIEKLRGTLAWIEDHALSFEDVIDRVRTIWSDDDRIRVLKSLEEAARPFIDTTSPFTPAPERRLREDQQLELVKVLSEIVATADDLPAAPRQVADRAVSRLSQLLSPERAWEVVEPWFHESRKFRRNVVVRVLKKYGVPPAYAPLVLELYRDTLDRDLLNLIGRNESVAALLEESDVIRALELPYNDISFGPFLSRDSEGRYWKMRAIQAFLFGGDELSEHLAMQYPKEFIWAVGSLKHRPSLPLLKRILQANSDDPEIVWRTIKAYDRMGEISEMAYARSLAEAILSSSAQIRELPANQAERS